MSRFKEGDRVKYDGRPATVVRSKELEGTSYRAGFDHLIKFDEPSQDLGYDWEGNDKHSVRYAYTYELEPISEGPFVVMRKHVDGRIELTMRSAGIHNTRAAAIDAAKELSKDGNEYLVMQAAVTVKIPQVEPVVTTL